MYSSVSVYVCEYTCVFVECVLFIYIILYYILFL